jgi:hypothetical protein
MGTAIMAGHDLRRAVSNGDDVQVGTRAWRHADDRGTPSGFSAWFAPLMSFMVRRANRKDLALLKRRLEEQVLSGQPRAAFSAGSASRRK